MHAHRFTRWLAAAALAALAVGPATGQDKKGPAEEIEALKKQVADLKKQVAQLQDQLAEAKKRAEANFRLAQEAVDRALTEAAALQKEADKQREELLRRAIEVYRRALQEQKDQGKGDKEKPPVPNDEAKRLRDQASALNDGGVNAMKAGKIDEAEKSFRQAIEIQRKLVSDYPAVPGYRLDLGRSHLNLANVHRVVGKLQEAQAGTRMAVEILSKVLAPNLPEARAALIQGYRLLGGILRDTGRVQEAEEVARRVEALEKKEKK